MEELCLISRSDALALLMWCGWKTATNWDNERMSTKLLVVPSVLPDDPPEDSGVAATLKDLLASIDAEVKIEVRDDDDPMFEEDEETLDEYLGGQEEEQEEEQKEEQRDDEGGLKDTITEDERVEGDEEEEEEEVDEGNDDFESSNSSRHQRRKHNTTGRHDGRVTRIFCAGRVLRICGIDTPFNQEMIEMVNRFYGSESDINSKRALATAYHGIKGFLFNEVE